MAQDLSSFALDRSSGPDRAPARRARRRAAGRPIVDLVAAVSARVRWTRLLYLYPSTLDDALVEAILATGVPYFDLSLQHVSRPLLKRMRRWGEGDRFLDRIRLDPGGRADRRLPVVVHRRLPRGDRGTTTTGCSSGSRRPSSTGSGFFPFSNEAGTYAADLDGQVPAELVAERIRECTELQDAITARRREDAHRVDGGGAGRRPRRGPDLPRGARDRRDRHRARPPAGRLVRRGGGHRRRRPGPDRRGGRR